LKNGAIVFVHAGTYPLSQTFKLEAAGFRLARRTRHLARLQKRKARSIGGQTNHRIVPFKGEILKADAGAQGFKDIYFRQLFFGGKRQHLARYPNFDPKNPCHGGWAYVDGKPVPMYEARPAKTDTRSNTSLPTRAPGRIRRKAKSSHSPATNWWNNIVPIKSVDREARTITLARDCSLFNPAL